MNGGVTPPADPDEQSPVATMGRSSFSRSTSFLIVAVALLAGAGAAGWYFWHTAPLSQLPTLDRSDIHAGIASAIDEAEQAIRNEPRSGEAWGHLAMLLRAHDFEAEADQCFLVAEELQPDEFLWPYLLGLSQETIDVDAALDSYRRAVQKRPRYPLARLPLAELLISTKEFNEAETHLQSALRLEPTNGRALLALARLKFQQGNVPEALRSAEQSAQFRPGRRMTHDLLAQIHHRLGNRDEAERQLALVRHLPLDEAVVDPHVEQVVKLRRDPHFNRMTAVQMVFHGQVDRGIVALQAAVKKAPNVPHLHLELARALAMARRTREAFDVLKIAVERHPDSDELRHLGGQLHVSQRNWKQAANWFQEAIDRRPDLAKSWLALGNCRLQLNDVDGARAAWQKAVRYQPELAAAHLQLARSFLKTGELDKAREYVGVARQIEPDSRDVKVLIEQLSDHESNSES